MFINRAAILTILTLSLTSYSHACSCLGFGPACTAAVSPDVAAVFLGVVESIGSSPWYWPLSSQLKVSFSVQENFKGVSAQKVSVVTNSSEAACGFPFKRNERYIVYAYRHLGVLYTSICQRTLPARLVEKDLEYLRTLKTHTTIAEIYGQYKRYTFDPKFVARFEPSIMDHYRPPEEDYRAMAPMKGENVVLKTDKGKELRTVVDAEGHFSFKDLAPGKYGIRVSVPKRFAAPTGYAAGLGFRLDSIELQPGGCAEVIFRTEPDGRILGTVKGTDGKSIEDVEIIAWNADQKYDFYRGSARVYAGKDGSFDLGPLPPGKYIVGAYVWALPQGFPSLSDDRDRLTESTLRFFPGTVSFSSAIPVKLELGQHLTNLDLTLPFKPQDWKDIKGSNSQ
jgi:hypothetical protein